MASIADRMCGCDVLVLRLGDVDLRSLFTEIDVSISSSALRGTVKTLMARGEKTIIGDVPLDTPVPFELDLGYLRLIGVATVSEQTVAVMNDGAQRQGAAFEFVASHGVYDAHFHDGRSVLSSKRLVLPIPAQCSISARDGTPLAVFSEMECDDCPERTKTIRLGKMVSLTEQFGTYVVSGLEMMLAASVDDSVVFERPIVAERFDSGSLDVRVVDRHDEE